MRVIFIIICFVITSFAQAQICFIDSIRPRTNHSWGYWDRVANKWGVVSKGGYNMNAIRIKIDEKALELSPFFDDKGNENNDYFWSCKIYLEKKTISQALDKYGIYDKYDGTMTYYIDDDYQTLESQIATKSFPFVMPSRHNKDHRPYLKDKANVIVVHYKFESPKDDEYHVIYKNTGFAFKVIKKGLVFQHNNFLANVKSAQNWYKGLNADGSKRKWGVSPRWYIKYWLKNHRYRDKNKLGQPLNSIKRTKKFIGLIYDNLDKFWRIDEHVGWYPENPLSPYLEKLNDLDFQVALKFIEED